MDVMENEAQPASGSLVRTIHGLKLDTPGAFARSSRNYKEMSVPTRATGTFEVKLNPQPAYNTADGALLGRMSIDKQFHGDLDGTSKGEMLTAMSSVKNSAGYVAVERVTGTLNGKSGSFALQHSGTMNRGAPGLTINVVPDSGTGQLEGLTGTMSIDIADGKHSYLFEYTLGATA
jgi:hypothetical protein